MTRPPEASDASPKPLTILLVDDNKPLRSLIRNIFGLQGWRVVEAAATETALRTLEQDRGSVDALVAELFLPGMRTTELSDRISLNRPPLPSLYYSSVAPAAGRRLGSHEAFLQKPFGMSELLQALLALFKASDPGLLRDSGIESELRVFQPPVVPSGHILKFYDTTDSLVRTVLPYLSGPLKDQDRAAVVATPQHWLAIAQGLRDSGVDPEVARAQGYLSVYDAQATLEAIRPGTADDERRFLSVLGDVEQSLNPGRPKGALHFYGEMVDLLWQDGREEAALRLEGLWNQYLGRTGNRLLCSCHRSVIARGDRAAFLKTSQAHSHIVLA